MNIRNERGSNIYYVAIVVDVIFLLIAIYGCGKTAYRNNAFAFNEHTRVLFIMCLVLAVQQSCFLITYSRVLRNPNYLNGRFHGQVSVWSYGWIVTGNLLLLATIGAIILANYSGLTAEAGFSTPFAIIILISFALFTWHLVLSYGILKRAVGTDIPRNTRWNIYFKPWLPQIEDPSWIPDFQWSELKEKDKKALEGQTFFTLTNDEVV